MVLYDMFRNIVTLLSVQTFRQYNCSIMSHWSGDGAWFSQHPLFGKYKMSNIYWEQLEKYFYFMFEGKEEARSSRLQSAIFDAIFVMLE